MPKGPRSLGQVIGLVPMPSHYEDTTRQMRPMPSHSQLDRTQWNPRPDGTPKGDGFLGALERPDGGVMSEFSVADSEQLRDARGGYLDYPTLVPTLNDAEVSFLLNMRDGDRIPSSIYQKAEAFAIARKKAGKPVFAGPGEQRYDVAPDFRRRY